MLLFKNPNLELKNSDLFFNLNLSFKNYGFIFINLFYVKSCDNKHLKILENSYYYNV